MVTCDISLFCGAGVFGGVGGGGLSKLAEEPQVGRRGSGPTRESCHPDGLLLKPPSIPADNGFRGWYAAVML